MPILLFKLNRVPEDEADDIRALLEDHHIEFYETHAGRWGISVAGIWLRDDAQLERAQQLIDEYQHERSARAQEAYEADRRAGRLESLAGRVMQKPFASLLYLLAILAILYFTIMPFLRWG